MEQIKKIHYMFSSRFNKMKQLDKALIIALLLIIAFVVGFPSSMPFGMAAGYLIALFVIDLEFDE